MTFQLGLHTKYYTHPRELLDEISPSHGTHFHQRVSERLAEIVDIDNRP